MKKTIISLVICILIIVSIKDSTLAVSQKIIQRIDNVKKYYTQGKIAKALNYLEMAFREVIDEQLDKIERIFPKAISPWKENDLKKEYLETSIKSGKGFSLSKNYYIEKTEKSININVVINSPAIKDYIEIIEGPDKKFNIKMVKGKYKLIEKYLPEEKFGEMNIVINQNVMISIIANYITSKKTIYNFMEKINYSLLEEIFG